MVRAILYPYYNYNGKPLTGLISKPFEGIGDMKKLIHLLARIEAALIDLLLFFLPAVLVGLKSPNSIWPLILGTAAGAMFLLRDWLFSPGRLLTETTLTQGYGSACNSPAISLVRQSLLLIPFLALIESLVILLRGDKKRLGDLLTECTVTVNAPDRKILVIAVFFALLGFLVIYFGYSGGLAINNPQDIKPL